MFRIQNDLHTNIPSTDIWKYLTMHFIINLYCKPQVSYQQCHLMIRQQMEMMFPAFLIIANSVF